METLYNVVEGILNISDTVNDATNKAEYVVFVNKFAEEMKGYIDKNFPKKWVSRVLYDECDRLGWPKKFSMRDEFTDASYVRGHKALPRMHSTVLVIKKGKWNERVRQLIQTDLIDEVLNYAYELATKCGLKKYGLCRRDQDIMVGDGNGQSFLIRFVQNVANYDVEMPQKVIKLNVYHA